MSSPDRRRALLATVFTVVALPAVWVFNRSDEGRAATTVGAAGVEVPGVASADTTAAYEPEVPVFLDAPESVAAPAIVDIVIPPAGSGTSLTGKATYRRLADGTNSCTAMAAPNGAVLRVENINNGQVTTCTNRWGTAVPYGIDLVLNEPQFSEISNLADAPVPVRFTW